MSTNILLFDLESNGFLDKMDRVHSLCITNKTTGEKGSFADQRGYAPIKEGLAWLMEADQIVGHNVIKFDLPGLQKVYPHFKYDINKVRDTLIMSRLIYTNLADRDSGMIRAGKLPGKFRGAHGLEAWGHRLGLHKGDYMKEMEAKGLDPWEFWNKDMQEYCELDVDVTEKLYDKLITQDLSERAEKLENLFAFIIAQQEQFGFQFDVRRAAEIYRELATIRMDMDASLSGLFPNWYVSEGVTTPKRNNGPRGYTEGVPFTKVKLQEFNPASRQQIADRLSKLYGWKPKEFTENGQPKIDESVLSKLPYEPAQVMAKRFLIEKRIGQLAEGSNGWLKLERHGRIHGSVNTIGAVTGRCTHSNPNIAQVPSVRFDKEGNPLAGEAGGWGLEFRQLFGVPKGWKQVGADASGLELRCLAHYMARYDNGAYAKVLLEGDIHTVNQEAAGLPTRNDAKTFIYAYLYGAGDEKIGSIIGKGAAAGKKLKANFLAKTPALKRLREDVAAAVAKRGYLIGIDGRKLHIRSEHSALNTLLQSAGALLVKQATINLYTEMTSRGYIFGQHWAMVAHVHDEYQLQVREELAEEVAVIAVEAFRKAGEQFNWRCPLDGEAKIGNNWAECH